MKIGIVDGKVDDSIAYSNKKFVLVKQKTQVMQDNLNESLFDNDSRKNSLNYSLGPNFFNQMESIDVLDYYLEMFPELRSHRLIMVKNVMEKVVYCLP